MAKFKHKVRRNQVMAAEHAEGATAEQLARKYKLAVPTVVRILKEEPYATYEVVPNEHLVRDRDIALGLALHWSTSVLAERWGMSSSAEVRTYLRKRRIDYPIICDTKRHPRRQEAVDRVIRGEPTLTVIKDVGVTRQALAAWLGEAGLVYNALTKRWEFATEAE